MREVQIEVVEKLTEWLGDEFLSDFNIVPLIDSLGGVYLQPKDNTLAKLVLRGSSTSPSDKFKLDLFFRHASFNVVDGFSSSYINVDMNIDNLFLFPGIKYSNYCDFELIETKMSDGSNSFIKPNPNFPETHGFSRRIIASVVSASLLMRKAKKVYVSKASDLSLIAILMGKNVVNILYSETVTDGDPIATIFDVCCADKQRLISCINSNSGIFLNDINGHVTKERAREFKDYYYGLVDYVNRNPIE